MIKRILVFDDDPSIFEIIKYVLEEKGWEVLCSSDSNDVVNKIHHIKPDIIMMDNHIPDHGGIVATQNIKMQKELQHIPVIFFTASENVIDLAKMAGADAFLAKPFNLNSLYNVIEKLLPTEV